MGKKIFTVLRSKVLFIFLCVMQKVQTLHYFIWVFTVSQSTNLVVSSTQSYKSPEPGSSKFLPGPVLDTQWFEVRCCGVHWLGRVLNWGWKGC